jgi:hypothetical protein
MVAESEVTEGMVDNTRFFRGEGEEPIVKYPGESCERGSQPRNGLLGNDVQNIGQFFV